MHSYITEDEKMGLSTKTIRGTDWLYFQEYKKSKSISKLGDYENFNFEHLNYAIKTLDSQFIPILKKYVKDVSELSKYKSEKEQDKYKSAKYKKLYKIISSLSDTRQINGDRTKDRQLKTDEIIIAESAYSTVTLKDILSEPFIQKRLKKIKENKQHKIKILICDTNKEMTSVLEIALSDKYDCVVSNDEKEALKLIKKDSFDFVVLDYDKISSHKILQDFVNVKNKLIIYGIMQLSDKLKTYLTNFNVIVLSKPINPMTIFKIIENDNILKVTQKK